MKNVSINKLELIKVLGDAYVRFLRMQILWCHQIKTIVIYFLAMQMALGIYADNQEPISRRGNHPIPFPERIILEPVDVHRSGQTESEIETIHNIFKLIAQRSENVLFAVEKNDMQPKESSILISSDGTITLYAVPGGRETKQKPISIQIHFDLPYKIPEKRWKESENCAIYFSSWLFEGIRYTQTVFLGGPASGNQSQLSTLREPKTLFVNFMGQSITNEYAPASVTVKLTVGEKNMPYLELNDGLIFLKSGGELYAIALLEVPPEGVSKAKGQELQLYGNMPPSINGSMTLKIPLSGTLTKRDWDALRDKDYTTELEDMKRIGTK